jgi:hypothetical protein
MPSLILGSIIFQDFEVPESIPLGGAQAGHMHKLPGGIRIFDAQGPDDEAIRWSGRFRGSDALARATALDGMRRQGALQQLSVLDLAYSVIITAFTFTLRRPFEIDYAITLDVIEDQSQGIDSIIGATLDSLVGGDLSAGAPLVDSIDGGVTAALAAFQGAVGTVMALQGAPRSSLQPIKTAAFTLTTAMDAAVATQDSHIAANPLGTSPVDTGPAGLLATLAAVTNCAALLDGRAYLGRACVNVINATG